MFWFQITGSRNNVYQVTFWGVTRSVKVENSRLAASLFLKLLLMLICCPDGLSGLGFHQSHFYQQVSGNMKMAYIER